MKDRSRFDALAEELSSEEPKSELELRDVAYLTSADRAAKPRFPVPIVGTKRGGIREQPSAWLSVMGRPYTVIEWRIDATTGGESEFGGTAERWRTSFDVRLKLPGKVPAADLLQDPFVILVLKMPGQDEMQYVRLEVRDVVVTVASTDRYTVVSAYGTAVS